MVRGWGVGWGSSGGWSPLLSWYGPVTTIRLAMPINLRHYAMTRAKCARNSRLLSVNPMGSAVCVALVVRLVLYLRHANETACRTDRLSDHLFTRSHIMTKTIKATAPVFTRDNNVGTLISEAGTAALTMLQKCKEAASLAAKQLDPAKPIGTRIDDVVALYVDDFKSAGHNVRALFKDALTLHAASSAPVVVRAKGKDDKMEDVPMSAVDALTTSKHSMRDAASQVREANGMGRQRAPKAKPAKPSAPSTPATNAGEVDQFSAWLDAMPEYLGDAIYNPRIVAALITEGWTISRAARGKVIAGKASA